MALTTQTNVTMFPGRTILAQLSLSGDPRFCQIPEMILFDSATSFIDSSTPDNIVAFQAVLNRLQLAPAGELLLVVGHTDDVGSTTANDPLSQRRAEAVLAVLEGNVTPWENNYKTEKNNAWSDDNFRTMLEAVNGTPPTQTEINEHKALTSAGEGLRATLFANYFNILLSSPSSRPTVSTLSPATLGCGEKHVLSSGDHAPSRRAEIFFFRGNASPTIDCDEYPDWLTPCEILPPTGTTVTIAPIDTVRVGQTERVLVTVDPSPLPLGAAVTLELSTTSGTGEARFVDTGAATMEINSTTTVRIQGVTASDTLDNIRMTARLTDQSAILAQETFMVVRAVSIFLKFEIWNLTTHAFEPLPAGVDVDVMDFEPIASNNPLAPGQTDAQGRVFFSLDSLNDPDEAEPDLFFLVRGNGKSHAGHTLPNEWSTKGWKATDGTPGFFPDFTGARIGTPATPLVFRVGLDFHAKFVYEDLSKSPPVDAPAPKRIPVEVYSGPFLTRPKKSLFTDDNGEIHDVIFEIDGEADFFFRVMFQMSDPSINLPQAVVNMSPTDWNTFWNDADRKYFPDLDYTSVGTQTTPEVFRCTINDRNVALYFLKILREWSIFLFRLTGGDWTGVDNLILFRTSISGVAYSWPVGEVNIPPSDHWDRSTLIHELSHQIMWKEVNFSTLGVGYEAIFGDLALYHLSNLLSNPEHALIEGWAEFMEAVFAGMSTPPYSVTSVVDEDGTTHSLGPPPNNRGESVEGAFANGLWAIFQNHVVTSGVATNAHVPESANGDILTTSAGPWIGNTAVKDRFLSMIWQPLKDLRPLSNPDSTAMINNIRLRNTSVWHQLSPELHVFNMAIAAPTISDVTTEQDNVSPAWGAVTGGQTIRITGTNFVDKTTVNNGAGPSTVETLVEVGGQPATNIIVQSSTSLSASVPPGVVGPADVIVTTQISGATTATFGSDTKTGGFIYIDDPLSVTSVTPILVPTCRTHPIIIIGTGFLPVPDTVVFVDTQQIPADSVHVRSSTEIQTTTPLHGTIGIATVTVQTPGQADSSQSVEYVAAPCVSDVTPREGPVSGGIPITITGQNFPPDVVVEMSSSSMLPDFSDATTIEITIPSGEGPGPTMIKIINPRLPNHLSDQAEFIYTE